MKKKQEGKVLKGLVIGLFAAAIVLVGVCLAVANRDKIRGLIFGEDSSAVSEASKDPEETSSVNEESSKEPEASSPSESSKEPEAGSEGSEEPVEESSQPTIEPVEPKPADPEKERIIEAILSGMTLEEKVGQMILSRFPGEADAIYEVENYGFGGFVLFANDFGGCTEEQVTGKIDACQEASDVPLLMAVDEEGGTVVRVSQYFRDMAFRAPRNVYRDGGWEAIEEYTREKCELLLRLHLNMNLAPVADMSGNSWEFMYDRSFGDNVDDVSKFIEMTVQIMNEYKVACSLKHFPGYGNNVDTHTGMAIDYREAADYYERDLVPFMAGMRMGAGTVMVSHNIVTCFDEEYPSSLSPAIHQLLRETLGFEGVIITDDLAMGAITSFVDTEEAAVLAVLAGNDMLATSSGEAQYFAILNAVNEGVITEDRIEESVRRILALKYDMGLLSAEDFEVEE